VAAGRRADRRACGSSCAASLIERRIYNPVMKPIISPNSRIRNPEQFVIGDDSIVDDYCYFSTKVRIGRCTHIASGCSIAGGPAMQFEIGDFCSLSSGVKIWCTTDDFVNDIVTLIPPDLDDVKANLIRGDVTFGHYTAAGANSVIMPGNSVPDGTVVGALSFVPARFEFHPWSVYAGAPIRFVRPRNRESVMDQVRRLEAQLEARKQRV
jgi:acetyltransferase-like isoleucine patch superfamily enzyme